MTHLTKEVSASYLHSKVTLSPSVINKYFEEELCGYVNNFHP